jgi:glycosyltransferase involved in cell wall biosynthesis
LLPSAQPAVEDLRCCCKTAVFPARRLNSFNGLHQIRRFRRRMSIGCLSSASEGFSNAILEHMAAGLPVVATDMGGNGEAIRHGETGFLVKDRTPESLAAPIIALLQDEERRCAMGRRAFERCRGLFSMDTYMDCLQAYYRQLVSWSGVSMRGARRILPVLLSSAAHGI